MAKFNTDHRIGNMSRAMDKFDLPSHRFGGRTLILGFRDEFIESQCQRSTDDPSSTAASMDSH